MKESIDVALIVSAPEIYTPPIVSVVVINAFIGFFQERKAERALQALRSLSAPVSQVVRDTNPMQLPSRELVVGDLVVLKEGDRVPADLRLSEASDLTADESALTGESVAVDKQLQSLPERTPLAERTNMAFLGTHVVRGRGFGLVVATAKDTEFGKIARMLAGVQRPQTPLQERLRRFGLWVVVGCVLVGIAVFALGILQRNAAGLFSNWRLLGAFVIALCLQGVAIYMPGARLVFDTEPLGWKTALALLGASSSVWLLGELHKLVQRGLGSKR